MFARNLVLQEFVHGKRSTMRAFTSDIVLLALVNNREHQLESFAASSTGSKFPSAKNSYSQRVGSDLLWEYSSKHTKEDVANTVQDSR